MPEVNIEFNKILEVALRGIRRSSVFMGLGVNAALDEEFSDYQLSRVSHIQLVPSDVGLDAVDHFKEEFSRWVVANAMRELVESFSLFLDRVYEACSFIKCHCVKRVDQEKFTQQLRSFSGQGIPNKLNILENSFGIVVNHDSYIKSINKARNCMTHRGSIVGPEDLTSDNSLEVKWLGIDFKVEEPGGEVSDIWELIQTGKRLEQGGSLQAHFVERQLDFELGRPVHFNPNDLAEICWFWTEKSKRVLSGAEDYARKCGVPVRDLTSG